MVDEVRLNEFVGKVLGDLGGAYSLPLVRIGRTIGDLPDFARERCNDVRRACRCGFDCRALCP